MCMNCCRSYPWGNLAKPRGEHRMNMWQGEFPRENTAEDGHAGIAPVNNYIILDCLEGDTRIYCPRC